MSELIHLKGLLFIMASLVRADYHDIAGGPRPRRRGDTEVTVTGICSSCYVLWEWNFDGFRELLSKAALIDQAALIGHAHIQLWPLFALKKGKRDQIFWMSINQ